MAAIDLTGRVFGQWTVIERAPIEARWITRWVCRCSCGTERILNSQKLRTGLTQSCGCQPAKTHGHTGGPNGPSPTYNSWKAMLSRCYWDRNVEFSRYGGRGITVCERWRHSFDNFLADMGERPTGKTIDRFPDNDGNYEPGNCRWATRREQFTTRSTTNLTDDLVREVHGRHEHGEGVESISTRMNIPAPYVRRLLSGDRWPHIAAEK